MSDQRIEYADPKTPNVAPAPRHAWVDPLVVGAIYAAGVAAIAGWPQSLTGADDRIAVAGPAAAVVAAIGVVAASFSRRRIAAMWGTLLIFMAAVLVATLPTLWPMRDASRWTPATLALVAVGVAVVGLIEIVALGLVRRRGAGGAASLVLLGMAAATGGLALMTGSMRIAEKTWPLAIALTIAAIVGFFLRARRASAGIVAFGVAVTIAQLAAAHLWSELALWQGACVLAAPPLAAIAVSIPFIARRKPWLRGAIVLLIAATPAVVASGIAGAEAYRSSQSSGADDNYGY